MNTEWVYITKDKNYEGHNEVVYFNHRPEGLRVFIPIIEELPAAIVSSMITYGTAYASIKSSEGQHLIIYET